MNGTANGNGADERVTPEDIEKAWDRVRLLAIREADDDEKTDVAILIATIADALRDRIRHAVRPRLDAAAVRDKMRLQKIRARLFAHEVLLENVLMRLREVLRTGSKNELAEVTHLIELSVIAGPKALADGTDTTPAADDELYEKARTYRRFIEELATRGLTTTTRADACALLGWPAK